MIYDLAFRQSLSFIMKSLLPVANIAHIWIQQVETLIQVEIVTWEFNHKTKNKLRSLYQLHIYLIKSLCLLWVGFDLKLRN